VEANGLSSKPILEELLREGGRRQVAEASLFALPVVKDLNIFCDRVACLLTSSFLSEPQKLSIDALESADNCARE
jgi:hypothetical protein